MYFCTKRCLQKWPQGTKHRWEHSGWSCSGLQSVDTGSLVEGPWQQRRKAVWRRKEPTEMTENTLLKSIFKCSRSSKYCHSQAGPQPQQALLPNRVKEPLVSKGWCTMNWSHSWSPKADEPWTGHIHGLQRLMDAMLLSPLNNDLH